jgi:drug/metabolite transporter (DMT)-like permease
MYAVVAALAWSTAGPFQRELSSGELTQIGGRAFFGAAALLVYLAAIERRGLVQAFRSIGTAGSAVAGCIAVASAAFVVALNHTTVAQVLLFHALCPIIAALLGTVFLAERIGGRTWLAMGAALAGVALMVGGGGDASLLGSGAPAVMTLAFAGAIVIARRHRTVSMAPAIFLAQVLLLLLILGVAVTSAVPIEMPTQSDTVWLALWGVLQVVIGFGAFTVAAQLLPAAEMALITLLEVVLGPVWVWLSKSERPGTASLIGGTIILAAVAYQALGERPEDAPKAAHGAARS